MNTDEIKKFNLDYTLFSWAKQAGLNPIVADKAEGVYFWDTDGKKYLDFSSQLMCVNIGHGNQKVTAAVTKQMEKLSYVFPGMATESRGLLGKKLASIAPGDLNHTFFTNAGAEAIENAIKLARHYTGRHKILCRYRSYHGATHGAMSAGGDPRKLSVDMYQIPGIVHFEDPYFYRCPWGTSSLEECNEKALAHLRRIVEFEGPENIAAILLEGESGSSGIIKYPPGYWKGVKKIADEFGILTIDDEVMSGFCRTGKWFAVEHHDVVPDMICMAKGLTSGYMPLGGLIVSDKIAEAYEEMMMPLGLTYSGHAVSCACANAVLDIYEEENLNQRASEMGLYLDKKVETLMEKHPSIGDWRNNGLFGCIELVKNRDTKEPLTPWNAKAGDMEATNKMAAKIRELGMFTFVRWNWIFIVPPLIITEEQIDEGIEIISKTIAIADEYCN
ncbi:MAG: aspartate aminotransferase family protein [Planctomycetota bacterium]|nr:MAG: aspartate aminotransferase family protein [Planctomycetota bacterium]